MIALQQPTILLDCRWLGIGGAGRITELLLRGLGDSAPAGRWLLWGRPNMLAEFSWHGAQIVGTSSDPRNRLGQHSMSSIPRADLIVFMHQQRPLRNVASITLVYDTIPLRHGGNRLVRSAKRVFLQRVVSMSLNVLTVSEYSRRSIVHDLRVSPAKIEVLRLPFDQAFSERVADACGAVRPVDMALYVGGFRPHKNLPRLLEAFRATEFRSQGGRLVLVGGAKADVQTWCARLSGFDQTFTSFHAVRSQRDLETLFATALFLIQPSLEEGFGLPVWEAISCGLPVCASDGGALPEVVGDLADPFPATSTSAMTAAIDACAQRARSWSAADRASQVAAVRQAAPTLRDFAEQVLTVIGRHVEGIRVS